jgi:hypothetical protein
MNAMERTTYRSLGSKAWAFDELRMDPQRESYTSGPSADAPQMIPFLCFCLSRGMRLWR